MVAAREVSLGDGVRTSGVLFRPARARCAVIKPRHRELPPPASLPVTSPTQSPQ